MMFSLSVGHRTAVGPGVSGHESLSGTVPVPVPVARRGPGPVGPDLRVKPEACRRRGRCPPGHQGSDTLSFTSDS